MEKTNKFLLHVEEITCNYCSNLTGHVLTGKFWTCVICGNQLGKKKISWLSKLFNYGRKF